MAAKKTVTAKPEEVVESTKRNIEETTVKKVYSTVETPVYKAPVRQRDMVTGHLAAGRLYDYMGKDVNSGGTFYRVSNGYVFVDSNVHIK